MHVHKQIGTGSACVYVYYFESDKFGSSWPCKIGKAKDAIKRIKIQQASMREEPIIGLLINADNPSAVERALHAKLRGKRLPRYGKEWLLTSPDEVEGLLLPFNDFERMPLHERIRFARAQAGMSQIDLAQKSGLRQATISKIESGDDVLLSTVDKVARVLGLRITCTKA